MGHEWVKEAVGKNAWGVIWKCDKCGHKVQSYNDGEPPKEDEKVTVVYTDSFQHRYFGCEEYTAYRTMVE